MSSVPEGQVSFDNPQVESTEFTKEPIRSFRPKQGETKRIAFISDEVLMRSRHYLQGKGYRRCLAHQGFCPPCIAAEKTSPFFVKGLKRATQAFGTNIFVFDTERGAADMCALKDNKVSGDMFVFIFGAERFTLLRSLKTMYGSLVGLDIQITCTDENFQKYNIIAYPPQASYSRNEKVMAFIRKKAEDRSYPVDKFIAKECNPKEAVEFFGINPMILDQFSSDYMVDSATAKSSVPAFTPPDLSSSPIISPVAPPTQNIVVGVTAPPAPKIAGIVESFASAIIQPTVLPDIEAGFYPGVDPSLDFQQFLGTSAPSPVANSFFSPPRAWVPTSQVPSIPNDDILSQI